MLLKRLGSIGLTTHLLLLGGTDRGTLRVDTVDSSSGSGDNDAAVMEASTLPVTEVDGSGTASDDDLEDLLKKDEFLRISTYLRLDSP